MLKTIQNLLRTVVRQFRSPAPHMMLQEYLFRQALIEVGVVPDDSLTIDHLRGSCTIGGMKFGIKYPRAYLAHANAIQISRTYKYVFLGNMNPGGRRKEMLTPFMGADSLIKEDNYGRNPKTKYSFNTEYYKAIRSGWFSLCPHQADWSGPPDAAWTYRFIESGFAESLPVVFRAAPLSSAFLQGFHYFWDDKDIHLDRYEEKVAANKELAVSRFFLNAEEIAQLREALAQAK